MFNVFSVPRTTGWRRKAEAVRLETEKAKAQGLPSPTKVQLAYTCKKVWSTTEQSDWPLTVLRLNVLPL